MFSLPHLLFMFFTFTSVPYIAYQFKSKRSKQLSHFMRGITLVVLCFDPAYWFWEWKQFQSFDLSTSLPLYLCSLFWIMLPFAVYAPPSKLKRMALANLSTIGLLGGIFGLVFNVYLNQYGFLSFVPMRSLFYHYIMILVGVILWVTDYYRAEKYDELLGLIPLAALLIPCIALSHFFNWDYAFAAGGIGTPLEVLSGKMPRPMFWLLLYSSVIWVCQLFFKKMALRFHQVEHS